MLYHLLNKMLGISKLFSAIVLQMSLNFILILNVMVLSLKWAYQQVLLVICIYLLSFYSINIFVMRVFTQQHSIGFVVLKVVATDNVSLYGRLLK